MRGAREVVLRLDVLRRVDVVAVVVVPELAVAGHRVVPVGVVGVVGLAVHVAEHVGARVHEVEVGDLALDGERALHPGVPHEVRPQLRHLDLAEQPVVGEVAVDLLDLSHDRRGDGPVVIHVPAQGRAAAVGVGRVVVVLHPLRVVRDDARGRVAAHVLDVVDEPAVAARPADHAHGHGVVDGDVDEALGQVTFVAAADRVQFDAVTGIETGRVGLVGDDPDRARLRARTEQRALRARQCLDALDVVDVHVECATDRGDRLLVEVDADARQRGRVVAVAAARDAAHVHERAARAVRLERHARQVLREVVEPHDVELVEALRAECLDRQRHVLQALLALLRGDHDLLETAGAGLRVGGRHGREQRGRSQRHPVRDLARRRGCPQPLHLPAFTACHRMNSRSLDL